MPADAPPLFVETKEAFLELIARFRTEPVIGIDTEAASFHRYRDRVYLLQLSGAEETAVVDPIAVGGLEPMGDWLADPAIEFVFHDADYDLRLLHREFGFRVARLFDTRVSAQFLGLESIGLAAILEQRFGVMTNKKWQRADWSARPLSPDMITYAATDTRFLPALREMFRSELAALARLSWVEEECRLSRMVEWAPAEAADTAFLRVKGARDLDRRGLAILRELFQWREAVGERLDRALFRVMASETLLLLSTERPTTIEALAKLRGVGNETVTRRGEEVLAAIERGLAVADDDLPGFERRPRTRPDPALDARLDRLKLWRNGLANRIGLPPGVLAPNGTLEAIARMVPENAEALAGVAGVRQWQVAEFGSELLAVLGT